MADARVIEEVGPGQYAARKQLEEWSQLQLPLVLPPEVVINEPPHYTYSDVETIDAIEAWGLGFHLGNVVKYISRAGKKDPTRTLEDLKKARWYLDRYIAKLEAK